MDEQKVDIREFIDPSLSYFEGQKFGDFGFTIVFDGVDVPTGTPCQTYFEDNYFGFQRGFDVTWDGQLYTPVGLTADTWDGTQSVTYRTDIVGEDVLQFFCICNDELLYDGLELDTWIIDQTTHALTLGARKLVVRMDILGGNKTFELL
jgi:hypothetical protein